MYTIVHHRATTLTMGRQLDSEKLQLLHAIEGQKRVCIKAVRRAADMAAWLQQRCPVLWQAGAALARQRWGDRVHPLTLGGAGFVLSLGQGGLVGGKAAARLLQPFERLEQLRGDYWVDPKALGVLEPGTGYYAKRRRIESAKLGTESDGQTGRFERLRARRASLTAACGFGHRVQRIGKSSGRQGDPGAPAAAAEDGGKRGQKRRGGSKQNTR